MFQVLHISSFPLNCVNLLGILYLFTYCLTDYLVVFIRETEGERLFKGLQNTNLTFPSMLIYVLYYLCYCFCCSVTKSCSTLGPHGLQCARFPCPSLCPGVYSKSCSLSWWCYLTISTSAMLFSFCLQSFPASGSLPILHHLIKHIETLWSVLIVFICIAHTYTGNPNGQ